METKIFGGKKIKIRKLSARDLKHVKKFQEFVNCLVEEGAKITVNIRMSLTKESKWLKALVKNVRNHKQVFLAVESNGEIVGTTSVKLNIGRQGHIGMFGISIRENYRGIGLGKYLLSEILRLAKKELKPKPKIIRLSVFSNNKPAIALYKKFGFREVARIPRQMEYKGRLFSEAIMILEL